jgi:hypothetical protein
MAGNFFQQAFEKTKSLANQAVDSTKCAAQKTKLKGKISSENLDIDKAYKELGRYYYNVCKSNPPEEIKHNVEAINQSFANIAAWEQEIREIEEQEARAMNVNNQNGYQVYNGGMQPQMNNSGMQPQMNNGGMQPQMYNGGMQPQMNNSGMQPQMNNGGMQPQMNNGGMQPQMNNSGMQPQMNNGGIQPQATAEQTNDMQNLFATNEIK